MKKIDQGEIKLLKNFIAEAYGNQTRLASALGYSTSMAIYQWLRRGFPRYRKAEIEMTIARLRKKRA